MWRLRSTGTVYGEKLWSLPGGLAPGAQFGSSLASMGDVSGDGLFDLAVGSSGLKSVFILSLAANDSVSSFCEILSTQLSLPFTSPWFGEFGLMATRSLGPQLDESPLAHDIFVGDVTADDGRGAVFVITVMNVSETPLGASPGRALLSGSPVTIGRGRGGLAASYFPSLAPNYFGLSIVDLGNVYGTGAPVVAVSIRSLRDDILLRKGAVYLLELNRTSRNVVSVMEVSSRTSSLINNLYTGQSEPTLSGTSLCYMSGIPSSAIGRLVVGAAAFGYNEIQNGGALLTINFRVAPQAFSPSPSPSFVPAVIVSPSGTPGPSSSPTPSASPVRERVRPRPVENASL